jgi:hypothetical protein
MDEIVIFLRSIEGTAVSVIVILQVEFIRAAQIIGCPTSLVINASTKIVSLALALKERRFFRVPASKPTEGVPKGRYRHMILLLLRNAQYIAAQSW